MFYTFIQNNPGGTFTRTKDLNNIVIIESSSFREAIDIAESKGVYFNGCNLGIDCDCCGDRWSVPYMEEGTNVPTYYSQPLSDEDRKYCVIHYKEVPEPEEISRSRLRKITL